VDWGFWALVFIVFSLVFILIAAIHGQYDGFDYVICSKCGGVMDEEKEGKEVCWGCDGTKT